MVDQGVLAVAMSASIAYESVKHLNKAKDKPIFPRSMTLEDNHSICITRQPQHMYTLVKIQAAFPASLKIYKGDNNVVIGMIHKAKDLPI